MSKREWVRLGIESKNNMMTNLQIGVMNPKYEAWDIAESYIFIDRRIEKNSDSS